MSGIENTSLSPSTSGVDNTQNFSDTAPPPVKNGLNSELASYLSSDTKTWVEENAAKISKQSSTEAAVDTYATPGLSFEGENVTVNLSEANINAEFGTEYNNSSSVKATADYDRAKHVTTATASYKGDNEFNVSAKYNHGNHEVTEGSVSFKDTDSLQYTANYEKNGEYNNFGGSLKGEPTASSSVTSFYNAKGKDYEAGMSYESKVLDGKSSVGMTGTVSSIDGQTAVKANAEIHINENLVAKADANYNGELSYNAQFAYKLTF